MALLSHPAEESETVRTWRGGGTYGEEALGRSPDLPHVPWVLNNITELGDAMKSVVAQVDIARNCSITTTTTLQAQSCVRGCMRRMGLHLRSFMAMLDAAVSS